MVLIQLNTTRKIGHWHVRKCVSIPYQIKYVAHHKNIECKQTADSLKQQFPG